MPYITPESEPEAVECFRFSIPDDPYWIAAFYGALDSLGKEYNHESIGGLSADAVASKWRQIFQDAKDTTCMIGTVIPSARGDYPSDWLLCDGQRYAKADYPKLGEVIAFNLWDPADNDYFFTPNLTDRFVRGGLTPNKIGNVGGADTVTLTEAQLPIVTVEQQAHGHQAIAHTHTQVGHFHTYSTPSINLDVEGPGVPDPFGAGLPMLPAATDWKAPEILAAGGDVQPTTAVNDPFGSGEAHENKPPYYTLRYFIIAR